LKELKEMQDWTIAVRQQTRVSLPSSALSALETLDDAVQRVANRINDDVKLQAGATIDDREAAIVQNTRILRELDQLRGILAVTRAFVQRQGTCAEDTAAYARDVRALLGGEIPAAALTWHQASVELKNASDMLANFRQQLLTGQVPGTAADQQAINQIQSVVDNLTAYVVESQRMAIRANQPGIVTSEFMRDLLGISREVTKFGVYMASKLATVRPYVPSSVYPQQPQQPQPSSFGLQPIVSNPSKPSPPMTRGPISTFYTPPAPSSSSSVSDPYAFTNAFDAFQATAPASSAYGRLG